MMDKYQYADSIVGNPSRQAFGWQGGSVPYSINMGSGLIRSGVTIVEERRKTNRMEYVMNIMRRVDNVFFTICLRKKKRNYYWAIDVEIIADREKIALPIEKKFILTEADIDALYANRINQITQTLLQ